MEKDTVLYEMVSEEIISLDESDIVSGIDLTSIVSSNNIDVHFLFSNDLKNYQEESYFLGTRDCIFDKINNRLTIEILSKDIMDGKEILALTILDERIEEILNKNHDKKIINEDIYRETPELFPYQSFVKFNFLLKDDDVYIKYLFDEREKYIPVIKMMNLLIPFSLKNTSVMFVKDLPIENKKNITKLLNSMVGSKNIIDHATNIPFKQNELSLISKVLLLNSFYTILSVCVDFVA